MMSLPLIAISSLMSPAWASATALLPQGSNGGSTGDSVLEPAPAAVSSQEEKAGDDDKAPPLEILDLGFNDCISRAERLQKMVVVFWAGESAVRNQNMRETVLEDPEVRRWIAKNAIITEIDTVKNQADARMNRVGLLQVPSVDIYSVRRALRLERLTFGTESLDFLAAVMGQTDGEVIVRPEGDAVNEPFRWLAWANVRYQGQDLRAPEDALFAYQWCMQTADALRPGFRARFLEFILRRVTSLKNRTSAARPFLVQERDRLKRLILAGKASRRDVYEYTRFYDWLRNEEDMLSVFPELDSSDPKLRQYQVWLLPAAAPVLGRYEQFESLLGAVGKDATEIFLARSRALEAEIARVNAQPSMESATPSDSHVEDPKAAQGETIKVVPAPKGRYDEEPLPHTIGDTRAALLDQASWVFEALLSTDRDDEAKALQRALADVYPEAPRAYALFVERALRQEKWALAAEIADVGMGHVDEKAQKRLARLQAKIAKSAGK